MTTLAHPEWVAPTLAVWAALVILVALADARARRAFRVLIGTRMGGVRLADGLLLVALATLGVAIAGPKLGQERISIPASGIDVVLLVDVSRSMDAADVAPSRLARAQRTGEEVLARLAGGDRAALAIFAGEAALLTPLTPDTAALGDMLGALDTSLMSDTGSVLGNGVAVAAGAFGDDLRPRAILVLSDGEGTSPELDTAIRMLSDASIRTVAVAIGSDEGTTIRDGRGDFLDRYGEVVVTRRETALLAQITAATGGTLLRADAFGSVDPSAVVEALERDARPSSNGEIVREIPVARAWIPAALALTLLLVEWIRPGGWRLRRRRPSGLALRSAGTALALLLLVAATPGEELQRSEAQVARSPEDPSALVGLGIARAASGALADAERAFLAAAVRARDPSVAALAYYDLGVAALEAREHERAAAAFYDALALDPSLRAAKFNLEWTLVAMREPEEEPPQVAGDDPKEPPPEGQEDEDSSEDGEAEQALDEEEATPDEPDPSSPQRMAPPQELSEAEADQWLDQVRDDPSRALQGALPEGDDERRGPRW